MSDNKETKSDYYEIAEPKAEALIESLRSVGYSLQTAIADIIDNSIAADASNVWIQFHWEGTASYVSIVDDGHGMQGDVLMNAMRPGSRSPLEERDPKDLGRFGLGLKTASFSQCRKLSVLSKPSKGQVSEREWDLDYVVSKNEWRLLKKSTGVASGLAEQLEAMAHGTIVVWQTLDRITGESDKNSVTLQTIFNKQIDDVREHLGMIFHRFLEGAKPRLKVWLNGTQPQSLVKPWDPFLEGHDCTSRKPGDNVDFGESIVSIRGYILPHKDKLSEDEYKSAAGPNGWNSQQGFYIYRNDRMLVSGGWLKLGRPRAWAKQEHHKLARLCVDIPNKLDSEWSLDVKKSTATPPVRIREKLMNLAESVRNDAKRVFAHRGEYGPRGTSNQVELERPWKRTVRAGHTIYKIDRQHVLVKAMLEKLGKQKPELEALLRIIEETVPVQQIWLDTADNESEHSIPYDGVDEDVVFADLRRLYECLSASNVSRKEALSKLGAMEPFNRYPKLISKL
tara:strand:- start:7642 stop:9168 length:1527 start_codon:yes stop_codon:yes gene_type:complete